ncbi:DUF1768-domain-containing protein [Saccharata proteae CBS 121410]|uniref:DUF1768-domain-containing protein n=1 Tax=Saccharata proteae CBS 121410 TaxID=1314787 RepID=A0A9P4LX97_9PEZI|nr:DUF1768-domain-containing protein [Saccharata proteae CBS 121410]
MTSTETETDTDTDAGPIFFWREYDHPYGFLSQWFDAAFVVVDEGEGGGVERTYRTAEEWMMVGKARCFGDEETAAQILRATTPAEHKALGRKVKDFDRQVWDQHKSRIVEEGNWHKFTRNKEQSQLAELLLKTGERELVEASPYDRIWGIGFDRNQAEEKRDEWGENLLGKALMSVRRRLKERERNSQTA